VAAYRQALALAPDHAATHNDLGNALRQLDRTAEAMVSYRAALRLDPTLFAAHANLGNHLAEEGHTEEARDHYRHAHGLQPLPRLRFLYETLLPVLYDSVDHVRATRAHLVERLRAMEADGLRVDPTHEIIPTHFYLAYQGENDRDVHAAIARLGGGPRRLDVRPGPRRGGKKLRIAFLSAYLRNHTIGQLNHGLIRRLSRDRFEVLVLSIGRPDEGLGRQIRQSADHYLVLPPAPQAALRAVAELGLDILYLPDVGMDALAWTLAFSRLAGVQVATWGHPVTTGLPTVDYFLSGRDLEVDGAEAHYTEKLIRLPRLGVVYDRPEPSAPGRDRASFGLPERAHLYLCPQTLFKFHPEFDALLGDILRRDPQGLLVLLEGKYPNWTDMLLRRFRRGIGDVCERVRFLGKLSRPDFLSLLAAADVMLDPIHFGGGNTSYEGLALATPIVTWPSALLRGRLTYAMYCQMGLPDLVAHDAAGYVERAVRLGTEPDYRQEIRGRIAESAGVLYGDTAVVGEVEEALTAMAEAGQAP
jgi:predicted O-linked N-acetylglucosamine transferase (SPINDLY family)